MKSSNESEDMKKKVDVGEWEKKNGMKSSKAVGEWKDWEMRFYCSCSIRIPFAVLCSDFKGTTLVRPISPDVFSYMIADLE